MFYSVGGKRGRLLYMYIYLTGGGEGEGRHMLPFLLPSINLARLSSYKLDGTVRNDICTGRKMEGERESRVFFSLLMPI